MKKSLLIVAVGLGIGYVLGTRAGRERYDEIVETFNGVWKDPRVAKARGDAARYAREQAPILRDKAQAAAKAAPGAVASGARATAAAAKDVADRTATTARTVADKATATVSSVSSNVTNAANDVAAKAAEARDALLEDDDDQ
jgi:hypothetical protein